MGCNINLTNMKCNQTIDIQFRNLSYAVSTGYRKSKKPILDGLNGFFRSTELTAIMGPSGAGKTTLLNILSGFQEGLYTGTVEYLNKGNKQDWSKCKKQMCYIQQTDILHKFFTVNEIMTIASYLKINRNISRESRRILIDHVLNDLKLSYTKETRVDQLSGGQKKRLSIALELINNPLVMFLDEPTTGLDSVASMQCVTVLKTLAQAGRTIICTIHQPSTMLYELFNHVYLVVNGHCMYRSVPGDTVDYFARQGLQCPKYHNPADYMMEVVTKEYGNYDEQLIVASERFAEPNDKTHLMKSSCDMTQKTFDQPMILTSQPTELMRFWILLQRCAILAYRDRTTMHVKLIFHALVAVLLGLFYEHAGDDASKTISNLSFLFVSAVYMYYTGLMPGVLKFPMEIEILRKERFNNWYQLRTYYMAMLACSIPLQIIFAFIYSFISYFMSSQPLEASRFSMYLLIAILTNSISESMGLGFGAVFNPINGTFVASIITCIMLSLTGFLVFFKHMTSFMSYISHLNVMRYVFDGLVQSVYGNNREKLRCSTNYCHWRVPSMILDELDMNKSIFWIDVTVLFGYLLFFQLLAYILLKKRLSRMY